jgi:hypothetical protein
LFCLCIPASPFRATGDGSTSSRLECLLLDGVFNNGSCTEIYGLWKRGEGKGKGSHSLSVESRGHWKRTARIRGINAIDAPEFLSLERLLGIDD